MSSGMDVMDAITNDYSAAESRRFREHVLSSAEMLSIVQAGRDVLTVVPPKNTAFGCALISALWAAFIRDNTDIPVHVVVGNLSVGSQRIFYNTRPLAQMRAAFEQSDLQWDGHAWIAVPGGSIGEASLPRTAKALPEGHWLRVLVLKTFGPTAGMSLGLPPKGWTYEPLFVLRDNQITGLVKGAAAVLGWNDPKMI